MDHSTLNRRRFASLLIAVVLVLNLQAAVFFITDPRSYLNAYELSGVVGLKVIQSLGILFLMWNVPYVFACMNPVRHRVSLYEAIIMQTIGLAGETLVRFDIPPRHAMLISSIERFILFDAFGLVCLLLAAWITRRAVINHIPAAKPAGAGSGGE